MTAVTIAASTFSCQEYRQCAGCGEAISKQYVEAEGRAYHLDHFTCDHCKKPIGVARYYEDRGRRYHPLCYTELVAIRCFVCGKAIDEDYYVDYWGNSYHRGHGKLPHCDFCDRLITGNFALDMVEYPDGRRLCGICSATAVTEADTARVLLAAVAVHMRDFGVVVETADIEVLLLAQDTLDTLVPGRKACQGFTEFTSASRSGGGKTLQSINVYLLYGMPKGQMIYAAAHELMHVWLCSNDRCQLNEQVEEGSCSYASSLVLKNYPGKTSDFILAGMFADEDPVYGEGYRRVKQYVEANGIQTWLKELLAGGSALESL
jgi:DNA-directed RNA polymerase subunit N (RpoN/RPB10)